MLQQLQDALRYISNNFITEKVIKVPNKAEAWRFFNYPFTAVEEALVNAVYHRSYEIREPIEVRIHPDKIEILSFPGSDPSISLAILKSERITTRRYRNRRIGALLKELKFTEGRGTGMPKIYRTLAHNGSPPPQIDTNEERTHFLITLFIHPEMLPANTKAQVYDEVYDSPIILSETEFKILKSLQHQPMNSHNILANFGYKTMTGNIRTAISKLLQLQFIAYTVPDKLRSKKQQYKITTLGINYIQKFNEQV